MAESFLCLLKNWLIRWLTEVVFGLAQCFYKCILQLVIILTRKEKP